jgi:LPXTG-site transpeptidase (sortase) family protein
MGADGHATNAGRRTRARVLLIGLALLAVVAAIVGGGYIHYQTAQSDDPIAAVEELTDDRSDRRVPSTSSPSPTPAPTSAPSPPFANQSFRIAIDNIGVDAPVVPEGMDEESVPLVPLNGYEVAWYDFTAQPGTPGNAVFAGHKTWSGEAVFYNLDHLQVGDIVRLRGENDGVELVYRVTDSFTVSEDDPNAVQVMFPSPLDIVTIITCDGTRYYTGDPTFGHDYTERRVVRAERVTQALG